MRHELKTWPQFFDAVVDGRKASEARRNERGRAGGDSLSLLEWDPSTKEFTGRAHECEVTYMLRGPAFGVADGQVIMALRSKHGGGR